MMSVAPSHSPYPGGIQQHPGGPQGHPMAGVPHNMGQPMPGQPSMPQQMHMGVSGPGGPQVSQAGALMGGMPPGAGGPSAHALQHLNPGQQQAQMYQQQMGQMAFANPQLQQLQQQQMMQHQQRQQAAARQALMAQQYSGMQMGVPNGMNQMNQMSQAQFHAMRANGGPMARPVNLPQHLQQAQQQISQQSLEQQQQQQQHQQHLMQQMAMQHAQNQQAAQAGNSNQGQQGQMGPQQMNLQQAQIAAQQHHQAQAAQSAAATQQQNQNPNQAQPQAQPQPQPQQAQPNAQSQPQGQAPQPQPNNMQQQAAAAAMLQQQQQRGAEKFKGQCLLKLSLFSDHLSNFGVSSKPLSAYMANGAQRLVAQGNKQRDDLNYWLVFVDRFFSPKGVLRHTVWQSEDTSGKQFEITFPALARYFHTHFESGIKNMQMIMEKGSEKELPNNGHYIESQKASFVYWFDNGSQLIANGTLRAHFDEHQKIELLEFVTSNHEEYIPRSKVIDAARPLHEWGKTWKSLNAVADTKSPEMNKKKKVTMKSPPEPPPEIAIPLSKVHPHWGITHSLFQFLELAEVMGQMNPLFQYSHLNTTLAPYAALDQYVTQVANGANAQQTVAGPRTPGMPNFPLGASPAQAHLNLPDGSPHIGSPAQAPGMQLQQSQHGTSSSGPSANTSPNASNKRRRPSAVKTEDDNQVNGNPSKKVNPSPRIGKRAKPS